MSKKPPDIVYGLDDKPPGWIVLLLTFQHICIIAISLVLPVLIIREIGGTPAQAQHMVAMSMVAGGIGVMIQSLRKGPAGSGYLCPQVCGPSCLAVSILAAKTGGLSLLCGMLIIGGVFEAALSKIIHRLKILFPTEVTGLIVTMVGITIIRLSMSNLFGGGSATSAPQGSSVLVGTATLAVMVGLNVWGKGKHKLFCVLTGMTFGYVLSCFFGLLNETSRHVIASAPILRLPFSGHPGFSFSGKLLAPILIATLCSTLKSVGDITTCQRINDADWKRPELRNAGRGILADAAGLLSAGLLGGAGQSTSSSNIGMTIATGVTSRIVAWAIGALLILLSLCPKVSAVFAVMPPPVIGATMIFALSFMIVAGFQIIMSRAIDARKTFVIGLSMIFGLSVDILPDIFQALHPFIQPVVSSSLSAATVCAILLNLAFRIGIRNKASLTLELDAKDAAGRIFAFMEKQGGLWGMRREVLRRAQAAVNELVEALQALGIASREIVFHAEFEETLLRIDAEYRGTLPEIPEAPPSGDRLLRDKSAEGGLALILMRRHADRIVMKDTASGAKIRLDFDH